jgi:hypothetical protein
MNYAAEMDTVVAQYTAASRAVMNRFSAVDAHTARGGAELAAQLRQQFRGREQQQRLAESGADAGWEAQAERERLQAKTARTPVVGRHTREERALPSDWTEEDQARAEGYGRPNSWLS